MITSIWACEASVQTVIYSITANTIEISKKKHKSSVTVNRTIDVWWQSFVLHEFHALNMLPRVCLFFFPRSKSDWHQQQFSCFVPLSATNKSLFYFTAEFSFFFLFTFVKHFLDIFYKQEVAQIDQQIFESSVDCASFLIGFNSKFGWTLLKFI